MTRVLIQRLFQQTVDFFLYLTNCHPQILEFFFPHVGTSFAVLEPEFNRIRSHVVSSKVFSDGLTNQIILLCAEGASPVLDTCRPVNRRKGVDLISLLLLTVVL